MKVESNVIKTNDLPAINVLPVIHEHQAKRVEVEVVNIVPYGISIDWAFGDDDTSMFIVDRDTYETWLRDNYKLDCELLGTYEDADAYWETQDHSVINMDAKAFILDVCVKYAPITALDNIHLTIKK